MNAYAAVFRVEPVKLNALDMHIGHVARSQKPDVHVDVDRLKENMVIIGSGDHRSIKDDLIDEASKHKVSDKRAGVVYASGILSAGREYFNKEYAGWKTDSSVLKPWIDANIQFMNSGNVGIVKSAILHLDEEAPHIHFISVPVTMVTRGNRYGKKQVERLSYNAVFSDSKQHIAACREDGTTSINTKLGILQTVYAHFVDSVNLVRGVTSGVKHVRPKDFRRLLTLDVDVRISDLELEQPTIFSLTKTHNENVRKVYNFTKNIKQKASDAVNTIKSLKIKNDIFLLKIRAQEKTIAKITKKIDEQAALLKENKDYINAIRMLSKDTIIGCFGYAKSVYADYNFKKKFNAIDFVMHAEKCDFKNAIFLLAERFSVDDITIVASQTDDYLSEIKEQVKSLTVDVKYYDEDIQDSEVTVPLSVFESMAIENDR